MVKPLTKLQKVVLRSLALSGKQNIQAIQLREGLNYATTHRSIQNLEKLGLIWMSNRDTTRGPKGAKEFSLTPYGVVESVLRCISEEEIDQMKRNWNMITPKYIQYWKELHDAGLKVLILQKIQDRYPSIVLPHDYSENNDQLGEKSTYSDQEKINHRDYLDLFLIHDIFTSKEQDYNKNRDFVNFIKKDPNYQDIMERWFYSYQLQFNTLKLLLEGDT